MDFIGCNDLMFGIFYEYCFSMESIDFGMFRDEYLSFILFYVYIIVFSLIDGLIFEVFVFYFLEGSYKFEGDFFSLEGCFFNGEWILLVKDFDFGFEGLFFKWSFNFDLIFLDSIMNY